MLRARSRTNRESRFYRTSGGPIPEAEPIITPAEEEAPPQDVIDLAQLIVTTLPPKQIKLLSNLVNDMIKLHHQPKAATA